MVDGGLEHLALRREPEAVIDEFGIARRQLVLQMRRAPVERQLFDPAMGEVIDGAARRLIHAARLHADDAVCDPLEAADAMLPALVIERLHPPRRRPSPAVDRPAPTAPHTHLARTYVRAGNGQQVWIPSVS